jgi:hypothetical protein
MPDTLTMMATCLDCGEVLEVAAPLQRIGELQSVPAEIAKSMLGLPAKCESCELEGKLAPDEGGHFVLASEPPEDEDDADG